MTLILAGLMLCALMGGGLYALWRDYLEEQAEQRRTLNRVMQASAPVDWPRPQGSHRTPWRDKRKEIAS